MMVLKGDAKEGGTALLVVLEPIDLHAMVDHGDRIPVPLEDLGYEGLQLEIVTGTQEEIEDVLDSRDVPYEKIIKEMPDGE